ncbi:energy transducer TonB [Dysgonomonas sp. 25]|uniref:energy transducer TonB n=1 Tax=Dysgonomonas sp. 25 TaxID=2302933 RepID=UPI0013D032C2|nr:energy transducer TonB [Dysgonomonas sp. 25]NDV69029.1 hypothetical protein [Dysgonomonas sp. 25]
MKKIIPLLLVSAFFIVIVLTTSCKPRFIESTRDLGTWRAAPIEVDTVIYKVEEGATLPRYKEGSNKILKAQIEERIVYPTTAIENGIRGRTILAFEIGLRGELTGNVKYLRTTDSSFNKEIIRAMSALPNNWVPSKDKDGFATYSEVVVTINFVLE